MLEEVAEAVRVVTGTRGRAGAERRLADVLQVGDAGDGTLPEGLAPHSHDELLGLLVDEHLRGVVGLAVHAEVEPGVLDDDPLLRQGDSGL